MSNLSPRLTSSLLWLLLVAPASADPPKVQGIYPSGGAIHSSLTVQAVGTFPQWPVEVWSSYSEVAVTSLPEKKGYFQVQIGKDAKPGVCWLRFYDAQGASTLRPFLLSDWRRVSEEDFLATKDGQGDASQDAQPLESAEELAAPLLIDGRLTRTNEVDAYAVSLRAGEALSAKLVAADVLGSPMDAVMQLTDATGRYVLLQNDDNPGLDPSLVFHAPQDGVYQVRVFAFPETPNSSIRFAGGNDYIYRLALSKQGLSRYAYPLAVSAGQAKQVRLVGMGGEVADLLVRHDARGLPATCDSTARSAAPVPCCAPIRAIGSEPRRIGRGRIPLGQRRSPVRFLGESRRPAIRTPSSCRLPRANRYACACSPERWVPRWIPS